MRNWLSFLGWPTVCGILAGLLLANWLDEGTDGTASATGGPYSYADAVQRASPAVVNIYTTKRVRTPLNPLAGDPFFRLFFDRGDLRQQERIQRSLGSGVIIDDNGYLLTNNHVIRGADEILVLLHDGREALAKVIGSDPETDLAVLKIDLDRLEPITIGNPDQVRVGDVVLAIGNPYGFGHSVSQGIISATGRYGLRLATYEDYLQTDAAINPGNSGGALVDARGRLLGINSAIYTQSGGSSGIGLAIPADQAMRTMRDLIEYGRPMRGWLGIEVQRLRGADGSAPAGGNGVVVTAIARDGPAARAGLQLGDLLLTINGQPVGDGHAGMNLIGTTRPGETVRLQVQRDGRQLELVIIVGVRPAVREVEPS
jgi:serine protease DegS